MATSRIARATESPAGVEPAPPAPLDVDVLVLGSGIAGAVAAITAASEGARVALACIGRFLGGSSFFPGTWGLGLIGPRDALDAEDLIDSILDVGQGVAEPGLVRTLVEGIPPAIGWLERELDVALKRPESDASADETAFIPCFDRNRRLWRGLTRTELERAFACAVRERGVRILERAELVDMVKDDDGAVSCAWLYDRRRDELRACRVGAAVLACGGTSGLFARRLTAGDVIGSGHGIALQQGCTLANIEFMQMMPGYVSPVPGLVFNEKTFRYIDGVGSSPRLHDISPTRQAALLEMRSGHGPFSARHDDRLIDLAIDEAGETGLAVHYDLPPLRSATGVRARVQRMARGRTRHTTHRRAAHRPLRPRVQRGHRDRERRPNRGSRPVRLRRGDRRHARRRPHRRAIERQRARLRAHRGSLRSAMGAQARGRRHAPAHRGEPPERARNSHRKGSFGSQAHPRDHGRMRDGRSR